MVSRTSLSPRGKVESPRETQGVDSEHFCFDASLRPIVRVYLVMVMGLLTVIFLGAPLVVPALLSKQTAAGYQAPLDSYVVAAEKQVLKSFSFVASTSLAEVILALQVKEYSKHTSTLTEEVQAFSLNITRASQLDPRVSPLQPAISSYFGGQTLSGVPPGDPILLHGLVSEDHKMMVFMFFASRWPTELGLRRWQIRENIISFLKDFANNPPEGYECFLTGAPIIEHDCVLDKSAEALLGIELAVLPVAMCVLAYLIRDKRLLFVPPIVLAASFITACAFVLPVAQAWPYFSTDVPVAMGSVCMALSLDFSLFFLTRFHENRMKGLSVQQNFDVLTTKTCYAILVSGLLISVAFAGAVSMPEENLQVAGASLAASTLGISLVNVLVTPVLLAIFGKALYSTSSQYREVRDGTPSALEVPGLTFLGESGRQSEPEGMDQAFWFRLVLLVEKFPILSVVGCCILFLPAFLQLKFLRTTADAYALLPSTLPSVEGVRAIHAKGFPYGRFAPYLIIVSNHGYKISNDERYLLTPYGQNTTILTTSAYEAMADLCQKVQSVGGVAGLLGAPQMISDPIDFGKAVQLRSDANVSNALMQRLYEVILLTHVNSTSDAALIQVHTEFLPSGPGAADWVLKVREKLATFEQEHPGFSATMIGGASQGADIRRAVTEGMPKYLGVTIVGITLLVIFLFGSVLLPLRLSFALLFTLAATFGSASIVYQTPLLHGIFPELAKYNGIHFQSVPIATAIAVALGLDYDIFLISRIFESRKEGMTDRISIVQGVVKTGGVISGAGVIMSLCFSGLLFSKKLLLQQFALLLVISVLIDTFVVRTILVPALMLTAGSWNWWPYQMPEPFDHNGKLLPA